MNPSGWNREAVLGLAFGLLVLSACGRDGLATGHDGSLDLPKADTAPSTLEDLAPPQPDSPYGPELAPELSPLGPDLKPPSDPPTARDLPVDFPFPVDRPEVLATEVGPDIPADRIPDLPADRISRLDLPNIDMPPIDMRPSYDLNPALDGSSNPDAKRASELCTASGGTIATYLCCSATTDFPDSCTTAIGGCACSPASSRDVQYCLCPSTACFQPGIGCVGPGSVCTLGRDQTCNDSLLISSVHGRCLEGGRCLCTNYALSPTSGKCL
jgi:hypothetical protein